MLWPSLVMWSSSGMKDQLTLLALFAALAAACRAVRGSVTAAIAAASAMFMLGLLRPYAFVVASIAIAIGAVARAALADLRRATVAFGLVFIVGVIGVVGGKGFLGVGF